MEELELVMEAKREELEALNVDIHDAYGDILNTEEEIVVNESDLNKYLKQ